MSDFDPLMFERLAVLQMSDAESAGDLLDRLTALVDSLCAELLAQPDLTPMQTAGVQRTRARVPVAIQAYRRWVTLFGWSEDLTQNALFLLATMADNLLCLGALAMRDPKSAEMVESIISGGQKGGQESGVTRQGKAADDATTIGIEAVKVRSMHPDWSQDKVATEIAALWKNDKVPGHTKIKGVLSELEKSGRLSRRRVGKLVNEGGSTS